MFLVAVVWRLPFIYDEVPAALNTSPNVAVLMKTMANGFGNIDPLAVMMSSVSPFSSCFNNPVSFSDPTGLYPVHNGLWWVDSDDEFYKYTEQEAAEWYANNENDDLDDDGIPDWCEDDDETETIVVWLDEGFLSDGIDEEYKNIPGIIPGAGVTTRRYSITYPKQEKKYALEDEEEEDAANQGGYENQYGREAVTLADFASRFEGMSYDEIMTGSTRTLGIKHYSKLIDPKYSFIEVDINGTMQEIDMVHFMVVGKLNQQFGLIKEATQLIDGIFGSSTAMKSAFYGQDLFSNAMGERFFFHYGPSINANPGNFTNYLNEFFNSGIYKLPKRW